MTAQNNGNNLLVQGRLVWQSGSNICEGKQKTKYGTNDPVVGKDGSPTMEYGFGLAIPKIDPKTKQPTEEFTKVWNTLHQEAFTLYPDGQIPPGFAMKFKDGDTAIDKHGKPYSEREGYAGHLVLSCTTQIPIKYFKFEGGNNILVNEGIKCGDYVNVQLNIKAHPAIGAGNPGLYVNPSAVQLIQPGKEIINTPSGDVIFGQNTPGYTGQVVAPVAAPMPSGQPTPAPAAPAQPVAPVAPTPPAQPAPNYNVIPANHQPTPAPVAPAMPPGNALAPTAGPLPTMPVTPMSANVTPAPIASPSSGLPPAPPMPAR